jgi:hypothetical protein
MKLIALVPSTLLAAALSGCVVAPIDGEYGYGPPPGVVYVQPSYVAPGPGYNWGYRPRYGWGYRHPDRGWYHGPR